MSSIPGYVNEICYSVGIHYTDNNVTNTIPGSDRRIILTRDVDITVGCKVVILNNDENEHFYMVGDVFTIAHKDKDNEWWGLDEYNEEWCIGKNLTHFCTFKIKN